MDIEKYLNASVALIFFEKNNVNMDNIEQINVNDKPIDEINPYVYKKCGINMKTKINNIGIICEVEELLLFKVGFLIRVS